MIAEADTAINDMTAYGKDAVVIRIPVVRYQNIILPASTSETISVFIFNRMNMEDELEISRYAYVFQKNAMGIDVSETDFNLYRYLTMRRMLVSIDDWECGRNAGWIVKEDWERVISMNGMLLNQALSAYENSQNLTDEESAILARQASIIFGSDNGKVMNPIHGLSLYCTLTAIWEKLGLGVDSLKAMRHDDYARIRSVMEKEAEAMKRENK